ncbi:MAG: hypothetical protein HRT71_14185 [Flavobacteriales bacterium]|nr:hypothetical protein [Flavobacteriales bacterium]
MKYSLIFISLLFIGCDCVQEVDLYISDDFTLINLEGVKIWKTGISR